MTSSIVTEKFCPRCQQTLALSAFNKDRSAPLDVGSYCVPCRRTYRKQTYKKPHIPVQDLPDEQWRVIQGYAEYAVSNLGRVKRIVATKSRKPETLLKPGVQKDAYLTVRLYNAERQTFTIKIHRLVAIAFIGGPPTPAHTHVNHLDHVRTNNAVTNLEYATPMGNYLWAKKFDRHTRGERHSNAQLSADDVLSIRHDIEMGVPLQQLAEKWPVKYGTIVDIKNRRCWKHI